jgi:RhtB (resistance to homoserine/threonine) family protein
MTYWSEFLFVAAAHLLAVASPGPDFAIVLRQSITHGRKTAIWTSLGVGSGISVHVGYSLLGIGLLISQSQVWFDVVKYIGAAYLAWIGGHALLAKPAGADRADPGNPLAAKSEPTPETHGAFMTGFLVNVLNPKAALFFIALFSVGINPHTPRLIQAGYGLWMVLATAGWFVLVSLFFTREAVRRNFLRFGHWFERVMGVLLLALAVRLAFASLR